MVAVSVAGHRTEHGDPPAHDGARRLHRRPARHRAAQEADEARGRPAQGPAQGVSLDDPRVPVDSSTATRSARRSASRLFAEGDLVDVTGVSKGKGFAGHIKRHNFHRGPKTHGSDHHRAPGSIGPGTTPGRVYKGMRMAGHMGDERVTIKKLQVVRADPERNLLLVKGSLPGARGSLILVKKA